jgi:hypothetical protein
MELSRMSIRRYDRADARIAAPVAEAHGAGAVAQVDFALVLRIVFSKGYAIGVRR